MPVTEGDVVTIEYTGRLPDGEVFDTSRESVAAESGLADAQPDREYGPLTVEVGAGRVIPGLEEALRGMEEGESEAVTIPPADAYGEHDRDRVIAFDRGDFEEMLRGTDPEEGMHVQSGQGETGEVTRVSENGVEVDFNHELAGETLEFEVEVVSID